VREAPSPTWARCSASLRARLNRPARLRPANADCGARQMPAASENAKAAGHAGAGDD
jgi:hypothetical protein